MDPLKIAAIGLIYQFCGMPLFARITGLKGGRLSLSSP